MITWAEMVATMTILGMLTFFAAFVVIFAWLGYSTWEGYKDLFGRN